MITIYDGFYLDRECKDIEEIVKNKANNFYSTYINKLSINKLSTNTNTNNINKLLLTNTNNINKLSIKLSINKYISIVKKFKVDDISSLVEQALADEVEFEEAVDELKLLN